MNKETLLNKTILQYKDDKEITVSKANRLTKVFNSAKTWKVDTDEEKMNNLENMIWQTRGCFQITCSEWNQTSIYEKVKILKDLVDNNDLDIFQLSMRMKIMGVENFNKDITDLDLVMGMSEIIDYLLREKN